MIEISQYDVKFDTSYRTQNSVIVFGKSPDVNANFRQGLSYHKSNDLGQAEICYHKVLAFDPHHAGAIHYLGVIALNAENPKTKSLRTLRPLREKKFV